MSNSTNKRPPAYEQRYITIGPLYAAILAALYSFITSSESTLFSSPSNLSNYLGTLVFFSYFIGGIPAGLTGFAVGHYRLRKSTKHILWVAIAAGFTLSFICMILFIKFLGKDFSTISEAFQAGFQFGALGASTALWLELRRPKENDE